MSEIRDPIYGFIELDDIEVKVIDTVVFQRLRKIRQLALANLVYPTANHTRFDHSLGVFYIAKRMVDRVLPVDEGRKQIVRLAALLHDLGHGPFSHISEDVLKRYRPDSSNTEEIHEDITIRIIQSDSELKNILGAGRISQIIDLLKGKYDTEIPLMKKIVSGPIDSDKQDYLLRDSYFCGVKYGIYDIERLINTLATTDDKDLLIKEGIHTLEQFVLAKFYMINQVYNHKTRRVTDAMLKRGIEIGIEVNKIDFLIKLYTNVDNENYISNYIEWYDDKIIMSLLNKDYGYTTEIFSRLHKRKLFKIVYSESLNDISQNYPRIKIFFRKERNKKILEEEIAKKFKINSNFVILNIFDKNPPKSESSILITDNNSKPIFFQDKSKIFQSIDSSLKEIFIEVYAPEYQDKFKETFEDIIKNIVNN